MPWGTSSADRKRELEQPIERGPAPPPPRGGSGTGVHVIGGNTRARQQAVEETRAPKPYHEQVAEYYYSKHLRSQAAERAEKEAKQRAAQEAKEKARRDQWKKEQDQKAMAEFGERLLADGLRREILAVIRSFDMMGRVDELAAWTKRECCAGSVEGWRMACEALKNAQK